jgi:hypothetical protein
VLKHTLRKNTFVFLMDVIDYQTPAARERSPVLGWISAICLGAFVVAYVVVIRLQYSASVRGAYVSVIVLLTLSVSSTVLSAIAISRQHSRTTLAQVVFGLWMLWWIFVGLIHFVARI